MRFPVVSGFSRTLGVVAILLAAAAFGHNAQSSGGPVQHRTWSDYGGGPDSSKFVALDRIDKTNVGRLAVAWTYPTGDNQNYQFNPIVVDNVMYVLAKNSSLVALDATTGKEIWIHANLRGIARRGINYWESADRKDRRLIFQMNNYLQAIDAQTGKSILTFGKNGLVDLKEGLGRDPAGVRAQSNTPGKIFENLILLGSAVGEGYLSAPGHLRAYDVVTGALVWTFHTIPQPGEFGYDTWPKDALQVRRRRQYVGRDLRRREARHRVLPDRLADLRLLRRRSSRLEPVRQLPARARCPHRQAALALPGGAPRSLGLRPDGRAAARHRPPRRQDDRRRRAGDEAGIPLRLRSRHRRAGLSRSRSGRSRRATCRASRPGPRSRSRPSFRRSRGRR